MDKAEFGKICTEIMVSIMIGRYIIENKDKPKEVLDEEISRVIKLYRNELLRKNNQ